MRGVSVRRCPDCGLVNRPTVPACECGFVFDAQQAQALGISGASDLASETLEDQRHYHMHRLTIGWFMIVGFVLLVLVCVALFVFGSPIMAFPAAGSVAGLVKGTRMIGAARRNLRALDGTDAKLPKAKLISRRS